MFPTKLHQQRIGSVLALVAFLLSACRDLYALRTARRRE